MAKQITAERTRCVDVTAEIRAELARQRISGRELARRLGNTQMYVARRLSGEVDPSAGDLAAFAAVLQVPVASFFGEVTK